jgi:HD superfamily phosphohydrolase
MVVENGLHAVEQFVLAKYYLTTQVYRHKVRLITDQMLIRAIRLGVEVDHISELNKLYRYDDSDDYLENYLEWDDYRLTSELLRRENANHLAGQMFRRLVNRQLFKVIFQIPLAHEQFESTAVPAAFPGEFQDLRTEIEQIIAAELSKNLQRDVDPRHVIVHFYSIQSVRKQSRNDEGPIKVHTPLGSRLFEERSNLFKSINAGMNEEFIECYAPLELNDQLKKRRLREEMTNFIIQYLKTKFDTLLQS